MTYSFLPRSRGRWRAKARRQGRVSAFSEQALDRALRRSPSPHFVRGQILDCSVAIAPRNEEADTTSFIAL